MTCGRTRGCSTTSHPNPIQPLSMHCELFRLSDDFPSVPFACVLKLLSDCLALRTNLYALPLFALSVCSSDHYLYNCSPCPPFLYFLYHYTSSFQKTNTFQITLQNIQTYYHGIQQLSTSSLLGLCTSIRSEWSWC